MTETPAWTLPILRDRVASTVHGAYTEYVLDLPEVAFVKSAIGTPGDETEGMAISMLIADACDHLIEMNLMDESDVYGDDTETEAPHDEEGPPF